MISNRLLEASCLAVVAATSFAGGLFVSGTVGMGVYVTMMLVGFGAFAAFRVVIERDHRRFMAEIDEAEQQTDAVLAEIRAVTAERVRQAARIEHIAARENGSGVLQ